MAKKLKLKGMVEYILTNESPTRDCDIALTIAIWKKFYPDKLKPTQDGGHGVYLKDLFTLPREDAIKRYRAYFQNDLLKYLPNTWEVAHRRKLNEVVWRARMGLPTFTKAMERHLEN